MIDFKKKKKGFASIMESLKSDQSKFEDLFVGFLVDKLNEWFEDEWNITDFPNGLKGKKLKLSSTFLDNFPKKLIISDVPALKKISDNSELNLTELIEKLVYFSLAQLDQKGDWKEMFVEKFSKSQSQLEDSNRSFLISQDEWLDIFTEFSGYFNQVVLTEDSVVPDISVLCHKDFLNIGEEGINNAFRTYCLMIGHYLLFGCWITLDIEDEINSFLKKHAPEKDARNSGWFSSWKDPKYLYSFSDINNKTLLSDIIDKNIRSGFLSEKQIDNLIDKLEISAYQKEFDYRNAIEFLVLALIHNGQTLSQAEKNKLLLLEELNNTYPNWHTHYKLAAITVDFSSYPFLTRIGALTTVKELSINLLHDNK
tara:strand:- start:82 stop:1185 length:1104 start_codon:yes stop_codon:yes gene_type:complete